MTTGDDHEIKTDADVLKASQAALQVSLAPSARVPERPVGDSAIDVLAELDRVLAAVPEFSHLVFPLKRKLVAAAAAEIRRLRAMWIATPHQGE